MIIVTYLPFKYEITGWCIGDLCGWEGWDWVQHVGWWARRWTGVGAWNRSYGLQGFISLWKMWDIEPRENRISSRVLWWCVFFTWPSKIIATVGAKEGSFPTLVDGKCSCCWLIRWERSGWLDMINILPRQVSSTMLRRTVVGLGASTVECVGASTVEVECVGCTGLGAWLEFTLDTGYDVYGIRKEIMREHWEHLHDWSLFDANVYLETDLGWKCPATADNDGRQLRLTTWIIWVIMIA